VCVGSIVKERYVINYIYYICISTVRKFNQRVLTVQAATIHNATAAAAAAAAAAAYDIMSGLNPQG
jgi:hypothetical protein